MSEVDDDKELCLKQLEKYVNKVLSFDEETLSKLAKISGKVIGLEFVNTKLVVFIFPNKKGLKLSYSFAEKPSVLLKGTLVNFINMMIFSKNKQGILPADMHLIGDISLAQNFQNILQNTNIEIEEFLSKYVGDTLAYNLVSFAKKSNNNLFKSGERLAMSLSEYFRFESEVLPDHLLVSEFCEQVDALRNDVDLLISRIDKIAAKLDRN